jgi:Cellulose biosynthesis protein BcsS
LGGYDYRGTLFGAGSDLGTTLDGEASYGSALLGYQFRTQVLFLKLFAGVEAEDQSNTPRDPENSVRGSAIGLKLAAGSWFDLFRRSGSSASMLRTELRFSNIGAWRGRAIALGHASRSGLKAARSAMSNTTRANLSAVELTLSGGFTGNYLEDEPSGYVSLGMSPEISSTKIAYC